MYKAAPLLFSAGFRWTIMASILFLILNSSSLVSFWYTLTAIKLRTQSPTSLFSSSAIKLKLSLIRVRLWCPPLLT